jgi:hypothetical protein
MKEENSSKLGEVIRKDIDYIKKYESFLLESEKSSEGLTKEFAKNVLKEDVKDEDIIDFCLNTFTLKAGYSRDIRILYSRVISYYKALVIIGEKDYLNENEISIIEGVNSKLDKVNFVIDENGVLVEKIKGYIDSLKDNIRNSGQLNIILDSFKKQIDKDNI